MTRPAEAPVVTVLDDRSDDDRGASFTVAVDHLEFLGAPKDMHVACVRPGKVRGNHFHAERRELIVVIHSDAWSLHWDSGPDTEPDGRSFSGTGAVAVAVPPNAAHAIRNDGDADLWLVASSDGPWHPDRPDAYPRALV